MLRTLELHASLLCLARLLLVALRLLLGRHLGVLLCLLLLQRLLPLSVRLLVLLLDAFPPPLLRSFLRLHTLC